MKQYGDLPKEFTSFETSKVVILPVPYDGSSTWMKGADKGPEALLEASANMEVYDIETDSEVHKIGIHTAEPMLVDGSPEDMVDAVYKEMTLLLKKKKLPEPKCWADVIKPEYKGEIEISHPASSGTAYTILAGLVQLMGEDQAFDYLKKLHKNISNYTRSGQA